VLRAILLVEVELGHALGIALERERPVFEVRQQHWRDAYEVVDDLSLGESDFRIQDLVEVAEFEGAALDFDLGAGTRHSAS